MRKIGITGGIGSGKSKVLDFLSVVRGAVICQSDLVAHQVQLPGEKCYQKVVETFGKEILNPDGTIDRKILGRIVFDQPEKLQKLNAIVHPAVNEKSGRKCRRRRKREKSFLFWKPHSLRNRYIVRCWMRSGIFMCHRRSGWSD